MIKSLTMLLAGQLMFSSVAEAGSCPMKMGQINKALETGAVKNVAMVKKLLAEGKAAHESGQHGKSVDLLLKAIKVGGI